tara:strand:+ start:2046 stop:2492 length:447 start_codon:yes stop_codon:yes gene_type:complete
MINLGQLVAMSQNDKRSWKSYYRIEKLGRSESDDPNDEFILFSAVVSGGKDLRVPKIKVYDEKVSSTSPCTVSCSCNYFRYRLALSLASNDATEVKIRKSDIPTSYTGTQKIGLCPHLMKLAETILSPNNEKSRKAVSSPNKKLSGLT